MDSKRQIYGDYLCKSPSIYTGDQLSGRKNGGLVSCAHHYLDRIPEILHVDLRVRERRFVTSFRAHRVLHLHQELATEYPRGRNTSFWGFHEMSNPRPFDNLLEIHEPRSHGSLSVKKCFWRSGHSHHLLLNHREVRPVRPKTQLRKRANQSGSYDWNEWCRFATPPRVSMVITCNILTTLIFCSNKVFVKKSYASDFREISLQGQWYDGESPDDWLLGRKNGGTRFVRATLSLSRDSSCVDLRVRERRFVTSSRAHRGHHLHKELAT